MAALPAKNLPCRPCISVISVIKVVRVIVLVSVMEVIAIILHCSNHSPKKNTEVHWLPFVASLHGENTQAYQDLVALYS